MQELKHLSHLLPKIRSPEKLLVLLGQGWAAGVVMDRSEQDEEAESGPPWSSPSRGRDSPSTSPSGCQFDCSISDVQPDFNSHNFRHDGHRKPVHQSLHSRRKNEMMQGKLFKPRFRSGSALHAQFTSVWLSQAIVQNGTAPGSWSRSAGTALTDNVPAFLVHGQPDNFLLLHGSPTATQLFVWQEASLQANSLSLFCFTFSTCTRHVHAIQEVSNRCRTPAPHGESFTAPLLLCQPDWLVYVQTHTFIRSSLSNTSPATRSPFTGSG